MLISFAPFPINPEMISAADIEAELNRPDRGKRTTSQTILVLVLSLGVFAATGLLNATWVSVAILVAVLFIHESGHWIGMKLLGYSNLQMFFIPFFGAAVSGKETNASGERRAIVSLLGPAPGIILGIICGIIYIKCRNPILLQFGYILVIINAFNLLPIYPLDGGRFMETVVFSRHPTVEIVFKVIAALALAGLALWMKSIALGILSFFTLILSREGYFQNKIVYRLKEINHGRQLEFTENIPTDQLEVILPELVMGISERHIKVKTLANRANSVWRKALLQPIKLKPTLVLLAVYGVVFALGIVGVLGFVTLNAAANQKSVIVQRVGLNGQTVSVEELYWRSKKISEAQLNNQGLYDGPATEWTVAGIKKKEGNWANGFWNGDWKTFDQNGNVVAVTTYLAGRPILYQKAQNGELITIPPQEWPAIISRTIQTKPKGPNYHRR